MDIRTQQLFPASFKGFTFYVSEESEPREGRNIVIHDYPNSGRRFPQDLGPIVGSFDLQGWVTGDNYQELVRNFKEILNSEGPGILVLPNSGAVEVTALPYKVEYDHKRIGTVGFALQFTRGNTDEIPAQTDSTVKDVFQSGDQARLEIQNQFQDNYEVPIGRKDVLTAIADFGRAIKDTVEDYTTKAIGDNTRIQNIVLDVQNNVAALVRDPIALSQKLIYGQEALLDGLFATFAELFTDPDLTEEGSPKIAADEALTLSEFGSDFTDNGTTLSISNMPLWPEDTVNRILRNKNRTVMIESVRINSLIVAFEVGANFDYKVSDDIDQVILSLEAAYQSIILVADPAGILTENEAIKQVIDNVRDTCYNVLDQKAQQVYSTTDLNFKGVNSVMNLSYKLYAENLDTTTGLERLAELFTDLNPDQNPTEMTGDVVGFEL